VKALVTGGNGFIGSHLVELLLSKQYTVRCLVRETSDLTWLNGLNVEFCFGDLFDGEALRAAVTGVDYVYHSAGVTKAKRKEDYYQGNTAGTKNILNSVAYNNPNLKRFIHISSQTASGPSPSKEPIDENAPPHPITTYGKSKLRAEEECLQHKGRIPITIVRPPVVYGPRDKDVFEFFSTMNKRLQPIVGFNEKCVSMIHVTDLVRGFVMAAESTAALGQTYFISSARVYNWKEIGDITQDVLQRRALRIRLPEAAVYTIAACAEFFSLFSSKPALINLEKARDMVQNYWTCDGSKAKKDFRFEQNISLEEGIRNAVDWYKQHQWL
jgi:nucleoside-diphosphate-sugar epimerase